MNESGNSVPIRIVELLISNMNELTKQVQSMPNQIISDISIDLERLTVATTAIINKISTPPRNEEIDKKLDATLECLNDEVINNGLTALKTLINDSVVAPVRRMTFSVWIVTGFVGIAMLISSIIVNINNKDIVKEIKNSQHYEQMYDQLESYKKALGRIAPQELERINKQVHNNNN